MQALKVSGEWRITSETQCVTEELKTFEATNYEIRGLHPDTRYRIHLRARNVLGFSQPAQIYVQTALGEYNQESNEVPVQAGFYEYTASEPPRDSSPTITSCVYILFISSVLSLYMWSMWLFNSAVFQFSAFEFRFLLLVSVIWFCFL